MPIYEYRCENDHTFDVLQRISDDPVSVCETCGAPVQRVFHPIAVHFKGSGFYNTDYGTRKRAKEQKENGAGGEGKTETASASSDGKSSDNGSSGSSDGAAAKKPAQDKPAKASSSS